MLVIDFDIFPVQVIELVHPHIDEVEELDPVADFHNHRQQQGGSDYKKKWPGMLPAYPLPQPHN